MCIRDRAVTSPAKSMVAAASKGRGIGRGNFYVGFGKANNFANTNLLSRNVYAQNIQ